MGLRINTNTVSINAQNKLQKSTLSLRDSMGKLASGERINQAADDAAGLAVSERMRANIRSLNVAKRNTSDGVSLVQTAEGGLMETQSMLVRLRELAIQSASDTIGNKERAFVDKEFLQLKDEINRIANSTEFNGTRLLVGNSQISEELSGNNNSFPLEIQVGKDYFTNADSLDAKNPVDIIRIDFSGLNGFTHGEGSLDLGEAEEGTRVNTKIDAQNSITRLDSAIDRVSEYRSYLGAIQNRLNSSLRNLDSQVEYLSEANSRIRDTDFAAETANLTKANILQQAGTSVLSSANAQPQIALSLLSGR